MIGCNIGAEIHRDTLCLWQHRRQYFRAQMPVDSGNRKTNEPDKTVKSMAKRISFEEILSTGFRWPTKGDKPFVVSNDPFDNANIAENEFTRLVLMMGGYKQAADLMVEISAKDRFIRDKLVFPIIFNYRQFLELSLKYQLASFGPYVDIQSNWNTDDLARLWGEFLVMLERYGTEDPDKADPVVGEIILEFAKIDPGSYSYRYPVDRHGNPIPVAYSDLHLPTLADVMKAVDGYFTGCDGYLSELQSTGSIGPPVIVTVHQKRIPIAMQYFT